jgi:hypothetical protein
MDTLVALLLAKTVIAATAVGIFDALETGPLTAVEIAERCGSDRKATEKLVCALFACRYLLAIEEGVSFIAFGRPASQQSYRSPEGRGERASRIMSINKVKFSRARQATRCGLVSDGRQFAH